MHIDQIIESRRAPFVLGVRKAEWQAEADIRGALEAARTTPNVMPVFSGGKRVGHVCGSPNGFGGVAFRPADGWSRYYDCTITTYNDVINAINNGRKSAFQWAKNNSTAVTANNWYDMWPVAGNPQVGAYTGAAYTARQFDDTTQGAILHGGNVSTYVKGLTTGSWTSTVSTPTLVLYDRVLTYEACSFNAAVNQAMTNGVAAQRYIGTGEPGLHLMVTSQTVFNATVTAWTQLQYTDNGGTTLQSIPTTNFVNFIVSSAAPTATLGARVVTPVASGAGVPVGPYVTLATGDTGMRLVDNFTTSAANTGTFCMVLMHPLATVPLQAAGIGMLTDHVVQLGSMPIVKDGACLAILAFIPTGAPLLFGRSEFVWG